MEPKATSYIHTADHAKAWLNSDVHARGREAPRMCITNSTEAFAWVGFWIYEVAVGSQIYYTKRAEKTRMREKEHSKAGHLNGRAPAVHAQVTLAFEVLGVLKRVARTVVADSFNPRESCLSVLLSIVVFVPIRPFFNNYFSRPCLSALLSKVPSRPPPVY